MKIQGKARKVLQALAAHSQQIISLGQVCAQLQKEPSLLNKCGIAANLLSLMAIHTSSDLPTANSVYRHPLWLGGVDLRAMLAPYRIEWPQRDYKDTHDQFLATFEKHTALLYSNVMSAHAFLATPSDVVALREALARHVWDTHGSHIQLVTEIVNKTTVTMFSSMALDATLRSEKAESIWSRVAPFVAAGKPRSVLLDGRPGTGKSTIVRWLASQVGGRSLCISASSVSRIYPEALIEIVEWLKPDVMMIDDFDRAGSHSEMLTAIEKVRAQVKLFVVSTNNLKHMDAAAVRPQRFDELVTVDSLGETFVRRYLGDVWSRLTPDTQSKVLLWPISYLEELVERATHIENVVLADEAQQLDSRLAEREIPEWALKLMSQTDGVRMP